MSHDANYHEDAYLRAALDGDDFGTRWHGEKLGIARNAQPDIVRLPIFNPSAAKEQDRLWDSLTARIVDGIMCGMIAAVFAIACVA
jgi:hypothetical protein